jgi:hypothetical protein
MLWYDWLYLFRHRRELACLDNILLLTRGSPLSLTHVLFAFHPTDHRYTGVCEPSDEQGHCIAQIYQSTKMNSAHINYLLQPGETDSQCLVPLLEALIKKAGGWGAKQVIADMNTDSPYFVQFRQAGFSVLAKQNVFKCIPPGEPLRHSPINWRIWSSADVSMMRCLYHTLVPPLVQPVEPLTRRDTLGLVCYDEKGDLQAYADLVYGPVGVWVLPIVHPQTKIDMTELLAQMLQAIPERNERPVYVTSRSYQPWVEHALFDLSLEALPEQALLVRYLAHRQRVKAEFSFSAVENGNREPTLPLAPIENYQDLSLQDH